MYNYYIYICMYTHILYIYSIPMLEELDKKRQSCKSGESALFWLTGDVLNDLERANAELGELLPQLRQASKDRVLDAHPGQPYISRSG